HGELPDAVVESALVGEAADGGVGAAQAGDALGRQRSGGHAHLRDGDAGADGSDDAVDAGEAVDERRGAVVVERVDGEDGRVAARIALHADGIHGYDEAFGGGADGRVARRTEAADGQAGAGERMAVE